MSAEQPKQSLDDPVYRGRAVRALLVTSPFAFIGCYLLAWVQGAATGHALVIAAAALGMCLAAAAAIHVMGSRAWIALLVVKSVLLLVKR